MHFLPIVDIDFCSHTQLVEQAVDLRVLHDGPPKSGVRIIGHVYHETLVALEPVPNANLLVTGPNGTIQATTDQQGIYDFVGLPPGHYAIEVQSKNQYHTRSYRAESNLKDGEVWGATLTASDPYRH